MISVLLPSRGRPELLARSVASLRDNAARPPEILVAADDDDPVTVQLARTLDMITVVCSPVGYARLHEYYAVLAARATGDWLLVWNDDATMMTMHWDIAIEKLPASVLIADLPSTQSPLCCFPAIRRAAVDALGRFSTANPHVDTFWQDVGHYTGTIASVPVFARHDTPAKTGQTHGFYEPGHQAELAACTALLGTVHTGTEPTP